MGAIDPQSPFNALLPEQFGKYSLLGHLATGGMAEVWLARQLGMQGFEKIVVIKRARPELADAESTELFLDEARLVATLEHPNIAQVYEIGSVNGSYFFVMEYIDGGDLRRLIETAISKRHPVSLADALYIMIHVCTALHYAHEKHDLEGRPLQIIHRDVSPSNVLISHDGAIKVCDFGIAKAQTRKTETTQSGVLKGKFSYMSPEQCQSKPIDRRSDVFSIGILLYELSTLSKLFRATGDFALLQQIIEAPIPPPSARVPNYPRELEQIVMKALAKDPRDRYPTAQALQLDLEEFAREHKLAMSSVRIAKLMATLFEKRNDAWIRAQRAHHDHFIEVTPHPTGSGSQPAFLAVGSAPAAQPVEGAHDQATTVLGGTRTGTGTTGLGTGTGTTGLGPNVGTGTSAQSSTFTQPVARRSPVWWLVGAVLAVGLAVGLTFADRAMVTANERTTATALNTGVEKLAAALDAAARSAHMRADGIATTPMLRAAIETDAATMNDLANTEMVFTADHGEVLEVFQFRGERATSLLRIPKAALSVQPLKGRTTKFYSDGKGITLSASAPISGYGAGMVGGLVLSTPVDLGAIQRALGEHATRATLTGLGSEISLVGTGADAPGLVPVKLAVPSSGDWNAGNAMVIATPKQATGLIWAGQARTMSGGLAGLLLVGFLVQLVRRSRS